jgi:hypothetical protein
VIHCDIRIRLIFDIRIRLIFDIRIRLIFDIRIRFIFGLDVELSVISGYVRNCAPTLETLEIINPDCWLDPHILTQCKVLQESLSD